MARPRRRRKRKPIDRKPRRPRTFRASAVSPNLARTLMSEAFARTQPTGRSLFARLAWVAGEPGGRGPRGRRRRSREARVGRRMRAGSRNLARIAARPRARRRARARIASPARVARKKPRDRNACGAKRRGDSRGPCGVAEGSSPCRTRRPRGARAGRGRRTFVCLGSNGRPSSSKSSLPLIARSGAYRDTRREEPNEGDRV